MIPMDAVSHSSETKAADTATSWLDEHGVGDISLTPDGWLLEANRAAAFMFRLPPGQEARGLNFRRFCRNPASFGATVQALQARGQVENWNGELLAFDGRPLHAVVNLAAEFDDTGALRGIRAHLFNITEWRRSQERTLFGQRVDAIGRLAGGVAHDFNNLLTVISGHAECLSGGLAPDDSLMRSVKAIQASSARAATLTQKLLAFGRRQVLHARVIDLADVVLSVEADIRRAFGHRVSCAVDISRPTWQVRVDPEQMARALAVLGSHAAEAMGDEGHLIFRLGNSVIGEEWSASRAFVKPGRFVRLDLSCAGMPLDVEAHMRAFEPFFSERGSLRDGMGLAAVFGLIKQSDGYIWLDADGPRQTTFTILLPAEVEAEAVQPTPRSARAGATVLLVDDDDEVRGLVVKMLEQQGYRVLEAATTEAAAQLGATHDIDLLVLDAMLGGRRSDELAGALLRAHPRLRIIGISGYPEMRAVGPMDASRMVFLEKPFSAVQLVERARALLER